MSRMFSSSHSEVCGFTLIECVVTILLLGILAVISVTVTNAFRLKAEQSMLASTDLLAASSCIESIKAASRLNDQSMQNILELENTIKDTYPNANITFKSVRLSPLSDADTTVTATVKDSACSATDTLCLVTVKVNSAELSYVISSHF